MNQQRLAGIEKEMGRVLSSLLLTEIKNPKLQKAIVSINRIRVTEDLKFADVYFTLMPLNSESEVDIKNVEEGLNEIKGFMRKKVSEELNLRFTPEIRIKIDDSIEHAMKITKILNNLK
ncbi:MAG: 30S ribosome-binding factor RbfA [Fusobacteriaceae bacterium]